MFIHLTKQTKFLVCVRLFNKETNTNKPHTERFTNCSPKRSSNKLPTERFTNSSPKLSIHLQP
ncbi:hypothetical protein Hanom_Chr01g00090331 [Helianthus anomalus]